MKKLKVGVIGNGSISSLHLDAYEKNEDVELYAVCDLVVSRAEKTAEKYGATRVYADYEEMLKDDELDAVSICTWNDTHARISIDALKAGKHVLVEKPLCRTLEQAYEIERAVKESGKVLQVGFVRRYAMNAAVLKRFIDEGELGDIYYAKATLLRRIGNPGGWFADKNRSGGGPLIDLGVHVIDLCWYMMGKPKVVSVTGQTYEKLGNRSHVKNFSFYQAADYDASRNDVEDMANAYVRFDNGATLIVDASYSLHALNDELSVKLYGTRGGAEIEPSLSIVTEKHDTIVNVTPQIDHPEFDFEGAFRNEIDHFVKSCRGEAETLSPVEDGVEMMKILCGIYESSAKGAEIRFD